MDVRTDQLVLMGLRLQARIQALLIKKFVVSGLTVEVLAQRLGVPKEKVEQCLEHPCDWHLSELSDFLFAMRGGTLEPWIEYLDLADENDDFPFEPEPDEKASGGG